MLTKKRIKRYPSLSVIVLLALGSRYHTISRFANRSYGTTTLSVPTFCRSLRAKKLRKMSGLSCCFFYYTAADYHLPLRAEDFTILVSLRSADREMVDSRPVFDWDDGKGGRRSTVEKLVKRSFFPLHSEKGGSSIGRGNGRTVGRRTATKVPRALCMHRACASFRRESGTGGRVSPLPP